MPFQNCITSKYPKLGYFILSHTVGKMNIESNKAIGRRLRQLRVNAGLTQLQLAKQLDKPQSFVSKIEIGERGIYFYELIDYAKALDITMGSLVEELERSLSGVIN